MNLSEREELRLVLLRDASVGHFMWLDRWQVSYPQVIAAECSAHEALNLQNQRLQAAIEPEQDFPLFIVAHGAACAAACALLFHADVLLHKRIKGLILVAPVYQQWQHMLTTCSNAPAPVFHVWWWWAKTMRPVASIKPKKSLHYWAVKPYKRRTKAI